MIIFSNTKVIESILETNCFHVVKTCISKRQTFHFDHVLVKNLYCKNVGTNMRYQPNTLVPSDRILVVFVRRMKKKKKVQ